MKLIVSDAASAFNLLKGIFCIYKPAGESLRLVRETLLKKLSNEVCQFERKEPPTYVNIEGDTTKALSVQTYPNYAYNSLVVGPAYVPSDFRCIYVTPLGINTSGVLVIGINEGTKVGMDIRDLNPMRTYLVKGRLGEAKDNLFTTGKTIDRGNFKHIRQGSIEKLCANMQSSHQRTMFSICGVDLRSETAYQLAAGGTIRPTEKKLPLIYSIKLVHFQKPEFTLEVQCVNEYEAYLMALIHDFGVKLRSVAYCTAVQCIQHSFFTLEEALLKKHWTFENVVANIARCKELSEARKNITERLLPLNKDVSKNATF